jgi:methionyl aminopeptidase
VVLRRGFDMEDYDYEKLKETGRISSEALSKARMIVKEGKGILEATDELEQFIIEKGYELAFPVNISINSSAAHYTPDVDDNSLFSGSDLIKIDLGARKNEYLTDCAITIDLSSNYPKLVEATEKALESAISMVKPGREVREIGRVIESIAVENGFKPIKNLGGHGVTKTDLHADVFIPNFDNGDSTKLEEGQVIAIEPFMTDGYGLVEDGNTVNIFQKQADAMPRSREAREVASLVNEKYLTYPFSLKWVRRELKHMSEFGVRKGISELISMGMLEAFPVLVEKKKGMVAQSEKELIVEKDSCIIVTK